MLRNNNVLNEVRKQCLKKSKSKEESIRIISQQIQTVKGMEMIEGPCRNSGVEKYDN